MINRIGLCRDTQAGTPRRHDAAMDIGAQRLVLDEEGRRARELVGAALDGVQPLVTMSRDELVLIALSAPSRAPDLSGVPAFLLGDQPLLGQLE